MARAREIETMAGRSERGTPRIRAAVELRESAARLDGAEVDQLLDHLPHLTAIARAITLSDAEADDVVAATIEIAIRHIADVRDRAVIRAWLTRIATREALRLRRRLRRSIPLRGQADVPDPAGPAMAESVAIRSALSTLSPRVRAAIVLHHMAGLKVGEVADVLGTSPNTVKTQLNVGLARLRKELGDE